MAHYDVFVQDSSPLFIYSPPDAWIDTPLEFNDSPSPCYHATNVQGATVRFGFVGTGVRVFSAAVPTPCSYELYVDGQNISDRVSDLSPQSDLQLLLGSIAGLEMAPHTVTLVNSGVTGDTLDLARVEVESVLTSGSSSLSVATFDDTIDEIQWGPGWVSALGRSTFYNTTVHYTERPDAKMGFSFEGDAIAIYGTTGVEVGDYVVTLDGQSGIFNGGSDGSVRISHDRTVLYLANGLSAGRHELTIVANPSSLGQPRVFNIDCIRVLSGSPFREPILLSPGSSDIDTPSTLPPLVPTRPSYASVISSTVFSTPLSTSTSSTPSPSLMPPSFTSPTLLPTASFDNFQPNHVLGAASSDSNFKVLTGKWVTSSAILSGIIAGIGLIFFVLFIWKRKTLDPPSYIDLEKANKLDEKGLTIEPGEKSPDLPIQHMEKNNPGVEDNPFSDSRAQYQTRGSLAQRGHSRNGSNTSSINVNDSAYGSYWETLQKRAQSTSSATSTDNVHRDSVGSLPSVYSDASQYSQTSERIFVNNVRMSPQFSTPKCPPPAASPPRPDRASPPRPPRVRDSLALPF